jgi:hypothetical protein
MGGLDQRYARYVQINEWEWVFCPPAQVHLPEVQTPYASAYYTFKIERQGNNP